jgi:hypothetical protein
MIDKNLLKEGDLILFHTRGFSPISMAIRQLTQSFFNHIGLFVEDIDKRGYVIEALGDGVVKTPIERYLDEKKAILKVVRVKQEAFEDEFEYQRGIGTAIARMRTKVGAQYDWWAIVWLAFKYLGKGSYKKAREFVPVGNPLQSREKFFCSEIVCESFYNVSTLNPFMFAGDNYQTCDTTTPKDCGKAKTVRFVTGKDVL